MTEFGHGIGADEPYLPYAQQRPEQAEIDLGGAHARARSLAETGDLTGARSMIEEALVTGEVRLGRDHPALVPLMVDLATIARRLGNLTEARNQLRRAHLIVVGTSGPDHPTSLSLEGRIAAVGYRLGEPTEAYDRHLADAGAQVLGPDHPAVRGAQQRLGIAQAPAPLPPPPADLTGEPPVPPAYVPPARVVPAPVPTPSPPPARPAPPPAQPSSPARPHSPALPGGAALEGEVWVPARVEDRTVRAPRRGNRGGIVLVASLGALVLAGAVVVAMQLFGDGPAAPDPVSGQTSGPAVTVVPVDELHLVDDGGAVTLSWPDPSGGRVPFVISGGRQGQELLAIETIAAGRTTATVYGLNVNFDYCFTIAVVWSSDRIDTSEPVCTQRAGPTTTPPAG